MAGRIYSPTPDDFPARTDLLVIGGGVIGSATAFYAARAGLDTLVIERRSALATLTTTRSLEAFRAQFEDADDVRMMKESIETFERFAEVVGLPGYDLSLHQQGYLFLSLESDGPSQVAARVAGYRAAGLDDAEAWTGADARRRFPWLSPDVTAASFRARDGWLASHELTYGFAQASGMRFFVETEVTGFVLDRGRVAGVETSRGRVHAPRVVVAAGPYSGPVAALAGVALPISPVRRHRGGIKAHDLIPRDAPMCVSLENGAHFRPEGPGAWLGWSNALEEPPRAPSDDVPADATFPALVLDAIGRFAPFWDEVAATLTRANVTVEAGLYDLTPDARPLIGATTVPGLYVNGGYSGHGVMGSAAGARRLADLLAGREREETNPYRLARFDDPGTRTGKRPL